MFLKVHRTESGEEIVAVCDIELMNRRLRLGDVEIEITNRFYGERTASEEEVREAMRHASCINLFGRRALAVAHSLDLVDEEGCIFIDGIPHAQIYRL